jgi:hypothetical protein
MPHLSLKIPQSLGQDEATQRLKDKFAAALAEHRDRVSDFQEQWQDHTVSFSFRTMGAKIGGTLAVEPERVDLYLHLPLAAMLFRGAIEDRIRQEVADLLK